MTPFLWKGYKNTDLKKDDLYKVLNEDESQVLGDKLENEWNKELETKAQAAKSGKKYCPSLLKAFIRAFGIV